MSATEREVVVITGASAGVGRATAHAFADRGARVVLLARGEKGLDDTAREVRDRGGEALVIPTDVAEPDAVEAAAAAAERAFGHIDVWVNNAMATVFAELAETDPEEFRRATEVTYLGTVYGTMAALRRMRPRNSGTVVQVGSALAYRAIPLQAAYCGAKFAIRGFTDSVRTELMHAGSDVWITMVQLPAVNSPQFSWCRSKLPKHPQPVPPIYQPEIPAETIWYAAHKRRREVWCGITAVASISANKVVPGLLDRYLARTGFAAQQIADQPLPGGRAGNLFEPVTGVAATHGIFDQRSATRSAQAWATIHKSVVVGAFVGCTGLGLGIWRALRS